jgi:hypothetical protein
LTAIRILAMKNIIFMAAYTLPRLLIRLEVAGITKEEAVIVPEATVLMIVTEGGEKVMAMDRFAAMTDVAMMSKTDEHNKPIAAKFMYILFIYICNNIHRI